MNCRYCQQLITNFHGTSGPGDGITTYAYWEWGVPQKDRSIFYCHRQCKADGLKQEAYECQLIDADCNDCRHFQRGEVVKRWLSCMENDKPSMRLVNMGFINGRCLKFDRPTTAQPNKWSGLECFEHRKS